MRLAGSAGWLAVAMLAAACARAGTTMARRSRRRRRDHLVTRRELGRRQFQGPTPREASRDGVPPGASAGTSDGAAGGGRAAPDAAAVNVPDATALIGVEADGGDDEPSSQPTPRTRPRRNRRRRNPPRRNLPRRNRRRPGPLDPARAHAARSHHPACPGAVPAGRRRPDVRRVGVFQPVRPVLRPVLQGGRDVRLCAPLPARPLRIDSFAGPARPG